MLIPQVQLSDLNSSHLKVLLRTGSLYFFLLQMDYTGPLKYWNNSYKWSSKGL